VKSRHLFNHYHQCTRQPVTFTLTGAWCHQHSPMVVAERRREAEKRWHKQAAKHPQVRALKMADVFNSIGKLLEREEEYTRPELVNKISKLVARGRKV
jgi:hypothetical protein